MASTSVPSATNMVLLRSSDGVLFEVDVAVALQSQTIRQMIEDGCADTAIPVEKVTSINLAKVIEYCKIHVEKEPEDDVVEKIKKLKIAEENPKALVETKELELETDSEKELKALDDKFIDVDTDTLYDLITAAHVLDIKGLFDLACHKIVEGKRFDMRSLSRSISQGSKRNRSSDSTFRLVFRRRS